MKSVEEIRAIIEQRYGSFELSHQKNQDIVENILDFVLAERKDYAEEAVKADRENLVNHAKAYVDSNGEWVVSTVKAFVDEDSIINAPNIILE